MTRHTPEELLLLQDRNGVELVAGEFVEKPKSVLSGMVEACISDQLCQHVLVNNLGFVFSQTSGIRCFPEDPNKVRKPDVYFVRRSRFTSEHSREGFLSIPPDLAVEVLSTHDEALVVNERVEEYLAAGIDMVRVVDPLSLLVFVHRKDGTITKLHHGDEVSGEDVVLGFQCKVAQFFPTIDK